MIEFRVEPTVATGACSDPSQETAFAQADNAKNHLGSAGTSARIPAENPLGFGECLVPALILHMDRSHLERVSRQLAVDAFVKSCVGPALTDESLCARVQVLNELGNPLASASFGSEFVVGGSNPRLFLGVEPFDEICAVLLSGEYVGSTCFHIV
ncbi:MAG: hypothetical protein WCC22_03715 [Terriglobales bacterium]